MNGVGRQKSNILNTPLFTVRNLLTLMLVGSVMLFTFYARMNVSSELAYINVPFYLALVLLMFRFHGKVCVPNAVIWAVAVSIYLITEISAGVGWRDIVKFFFLYCAPLLACQVSFGGAQAKWFLRTIIRLMNACVLLVFTILLIDLCTGSAAMRAITSAFLPAMSEWIASGIFERHASIWGHYLSTAGFYLIFFFTNIAYAKIEGKYLLDVRLLYVIATLGILSTGGKSAAVVYLISIVWINLTAKNGIRNAVVLTVFLLALYFLGAFDIVLGRFEADDLSSGRNESTLMMFSHEMPGLFSGYGERFTSHASALIGSFNAAMFMEYSLLALSYKFGFVFTLIECALLLWPAFSLSRRTGYWIIAFMSLMALVYFATYNGLLVVPDIYLTMVLFGICLNLMNRHGYATNPQLDGVA